MTESNFSFAMRRGPNTAAADEEIDTNDATVQLGQVNEENGVAEASGFMDEMSRRLRVDHERTQSRFAAICLARGFEFFGQAAAVLAGFVAETLDPALNEA